jgi:uncharacterized protein YceH (UPF0502 family)
MLECRILGVLIEKQKTTPDIYPLSVNALVTGSNQKSNRDPVLALDDVAVEDTLAHLQTLGLVSRIESGRVEKWRHHIYERWQVSKEEIAVLAELLLRGAQTEGELRTRASRMEPLGDRDALRRVLQPLVERRLAIWLTPEGRRGALLSHGFHDPQELEKLKARASAGAELEPAPTRPTSESSSRVESLEAAVSELQARVAALEERLSASLRTASPPPNPSA